MPDTMVWRECNTRHQLEAIMQDRVTACKPPLKLYADKIYTPGILIEAAHSLKRNPGGLLNFQLAQNAIMTRIRVGIEWSFGKIVGRSKYVEFGRAMKLLESPVDQYYHVAVLFANAHTCLYGSQHTTYFGIEPPSLTEYFSQ
jgi:nuclease HARBI1